MNQTKFETNNFLIYSFFILALVSFFLPLGTLPLFDLDEGAFSEATREMLISKDYITTYLNGELRFDKPILIYWLQAISVSTFGLNEFALRLPSAIASILWVGAIYFFTKRYFNKTVALYAIIIFVSSLQITIIAKAAIADALLNLFIAASMFAIYNFYHTRDKKYIYIAFAFIALGVLTKGPVAIMVPFVVSFLFFTIRKEFILWLKTIFNPIGLIIFVIIASPWYILEYQAQGQLFIDGFFLKHNLSRFNSAMEGHAGSFLYYIPVLLLGLMPNTGLFVATIKRLKEFLQNDLNLYLSIWFLFIVIFFSFSDTKLPHYIIYGYTPLFIFMAYILVNITTETKKVYLTLFSPSIFFLLLFLSLPYIFKAIEVKDKFANSIKPEIIAAFGFNYQVTLIGTILILLVLFKMKNISLQMKFILNNFIFVMLINFLIVPTVAKVQQDPIKNIALIAKKENLDIVMHRMNTPSFNVYAQRLVTKTPPKSNDYVITKKMYLGDFKDGYILLYEEMGIVLILTK